MFGTLLILQSFLMLRTFLNYLLNLIIKLLLFQKIDPNARELS